ncbi:MAG: pre-peptidase, partial [Planctomycetes bacterium]|nr:pre-peptidase [Planctomycetota bacterium]
MFSRLIAAFLLSLGLVTLSFGQTSYPMITHVTPVAIQRGKTIELTIDGQMNFHGVHTMMVEGKGITVESLPLPPKNDGPAPQVKSVKMKVGVAADAALGVREFRLASTLGISTLGQLLVTDDPVILETGDNNTHAKAQAISVPCLISGRIEALEDVDCFRFKAKAGQTITCEVYCARIEDKIHDLQKHADPMVSLFDKDGRELAASDDGIFADPLMAFTIKQDGEYILQIRDAKYDGDPRWVYALAVTDKPYVSQIFPLAMNPGQAVTVEPVGSAKLAQ